MAVDARRPRLFLRQFEMMMARGVVTKPSGTREGLMTDGSVICTDRLVLRDFRLSDGDAVHEFATHPGTAEFSDWGPGSRGDTEEFVRICSMQSDIVGRTVFNLAAVSVETDRLVGTVSISIENPLHGRGEMGVGIHPALWGRGYGTEATTALIRFGFDDLDLNRIAATCHPDNIASVRTMKRSGMLYEGRMRHHMRFRGQWRDSLLFAVTRC